MSENRQDPMTNKTQNIDPVEARLGALVPVAPQVDRDALMYQAGWAAAQAVPRGLNSRKVSPQFWKVTTGLMTAATVILALMLFRQPDSSSTRIVQTVESGDLEKTVEDPSLLADIPEAVAILDVVADESRRPAARHASYVLVHPSANYLALREVALTRGVDDWPIDYRQPTSEASREPSNRTSTVRQLMNELLPGVPTEPAPEADSPTEASTRDEESIV